MCPTRLSELCYDTHLKCESCRGQVCSDVIFCSECEGWSSDFRKLYLKHKKSLHTKRVSKQNRRAGKSKGKSPSTIPPPQRADAPTPSDDAASVASQESHVTPPVVYFPLNQDIINANITVEQLQQFQQVDNIVEVQLENPPAPTTVPPQFDSTSADRTDKVVTAIEKMLPFLVELVAERQSEKEKKSASAINPVVSPPVSAPQVPVVAPQDPSPAPGPSDASIEPLPSTSGLQQPPQHAVASPRGRSSERVTSERSRHASPSFQDRLRLHIDDVKRQLSNTMEIDDLYRSQGRLPPDQISHDLGYLQDRLSHLQSSLADSLASSLGVITSTCAHAVASPAPTPVASGSSTSCFSSRHDRRYEQRVASSDIGAISGRPCSRESSQTSPHHPSSQRFSSSKRSLSPRRTPSPTQRRGASRRTPSPTQRRGASRRTPSPTRRRDASRRTPSPARRSSSRRTPSPQRRADSKGSSNSRKRSLRDSLSPRRGSPPPKRQRRQERDLSLPQCNAPHGPHPGNHHRRDQDHGLLMARLLLQERKKKLKTPQFRPQSRLWLTLLSPTSWTLSPRRLRSPPGLLTCRFRLVSLTQRFLRDLSWAGPRLCQTPLPKPKRNSPREFKRAEPAIRCFLLLTALRRSPTLLLRARNLSQTQTCLTSSETRSLISAFFPSRLRKESPWKGLFALYWSPRVSLHGR